MRTHLLTILQLDKQLKEWLEANKKYSRPRIGWIKTIRKALCMSAEQLGIRMGLTRSRIAQLESAEINDAVTLRTLRKAANAMGCELIYAIVPKSESSLENIIKMRAEQIANERITRIAHSMNLEAQSVNAENLKKQKEELAKMLREHIDKKLWSISEVDIQEELKKNTDENRLQHLIKKLEKKK